MRVSSIVAFPTKYVIIFASVLFLGQWLSNTDTAFSMLTMLFVIVFAISFNVAGGLVYPSGAFIFFNGVLTALLGIVYKVIIWEPGETNLRLPNTTMLVYCGGMAMMGLVAYLSRSVLPKRAFLASAVNIGQMKQAARACFLVGLSIQVFGVLLPKLLYTALQQINHFAEFAIILAVFYEIRTSDGVSTTNWIVWAAGADIFFFGLIGFSKQGLFTPLFTWLLPCILLGARFRRLQLVALVLTVALMFYYLVPYSQLVRSYRVENGTNLDNLKVAVKYLSDLGSTRKEYLAVIGDYHDPSYGAPHYYTNPQGFFDRLEMLAFDDALIQHTDEYGEIGLAPTYLSYANLVPRVFYPNKPDIHFGNDYAHDLGLLSRDDTTTGISFSPAADAYHQAGWFGVLVVLPVVLFLLFVITNWLAGDVRETPWGLLPLVTFAHIAPEGGLGGAIYATGYGTFAILVAAGVVAYVLPLVNALYFGHRRIAGTVASGTSANMRGSRGSFPHRRTDTRNGRLG